MRISKFFYITLLMAIVIVPTSSNLHAQLTFYSSSSAFTVATGPGLTDLTFQPDLSLQPFLVVSSPLSSASSTTYQDVTGSIPNGITISDQAQIRVQKFSLVAFIVLTILGWGAILGFLRNPQSSQPTVYRPVHSRVA